MTQVDDRVKWGLAGHKSQDGDSLSPKERDNTGDRKVAERYGK